MGFIGRVHVTILYWRVAQRKKGASLGIYSRIAVGRQSSFIVGESLSNTIKNK